LYCPCDISIVMSIWRWLLPQNFFHGNSLKALLKSYDDNHICDVDVKGTICVKKKNIPFIRGKKNPWMLMFLCQGSTNCCLKNPFELLELLFVVPWIVVNIFCAKKLHWWKRSFGRCLMKIKKLWFGHPTTITLESWCQEMKIHHYLRCWGLWKILVQIVGLVRSTYMFYKWESQCGYRFLPHGNKRTKK
jgi:hypothetical protein